MLELNTRLLRTCVAEFFDKMQSQTSFDKMQSYTSFEEEIYCEIHVNECRAEKGSVLIKTSSSIIGRADKQIGIKKSPRYALG